MITIILVILSKQRFSSYLKKIRFLCQIWSHTSEKNFGNNFHPMYWQKNLWDNQRWQKKLIFLQNDSKICLLLLNLLFFNQKYFYHFWWRSRPILFFFFPYCFCFMVKISRETIYQKSTFFVKNHSNLRNRKS